jgi:predicted short-subunit dehydrogenase-like oxidoreductase (DUF2520 family)
VKTLNVIGCGRVGKTLARLLHQNRVCEVQDLRALKQADAERAATFVGAGRPVTALDAMRPANLWILAVPDARIAQAAADLAVAESVRANSIGGPVVAFHCSGFHPASLLDPLRRLGWQAASVHPVLSFAEPESALMQFPGTPCGIEGDETAAATLRSIFTAIGAQCFTVDGERKALYHAAAVFANNFTVVLQSIAREAWAEAGVPEELANRMQESLLRATVDNFVRLGPAAITGPAARGDKEVVAAQAAAVSQWHPQAGIVYRELSALAQRLAAQCTTLPGPPD